MGNMKILALVLASLAALVYRDTALALLVGFGGVTGLCFVGGFVVSSLSAIGRYFIPHGLIACGLAVLLSMIPGLPGIGDLPMPPAATVGATQAWFVDNWNFASGLNLAAVCAVVCIVAVALIAALVQVVRNRETTERSTAPSVARAMIAQRKFMGYHIVEGEKRISQANVGSIPSPLVHARPAPTVAAAGGVRAPLPDEWIHQRIDPAHLLDEVISALLSDPSDVQFECADGAIKIKRKDIPTLDRIIEQVRLASPQPTGAP